MVSLEQSIYQLIRRTSFDLPDDVEKALIKGREQEIEGSNAERTLTAILENIALARRENVPVCQDTGSLLFWVKAPVGFPRKHFEQAAVKAIGKATEKGVLRQNCVDSLTGRNTGDNIGLGSPAIHWEENNTDTIHISLILKGGGCENVGAQYSLPNSSLAADRDLQGVRKCCLDAVWRAQGMGCAPGILGVCIGGDRATGYEKSKQQFLRRLGRRSREQPLADLEMQVLSQANQLTIGPMGFGGKTTLLDVLIARLDRLPASFFVSVSYMCWAFRRQSTALPGTVK